MSVMLKRDDGATVLVVAMAMLVLLGFAALTIDIGFGYNERRLDQTAADVSVVGGAVTTSLSGIAAGAADVQALVDTNLSRTVTNWNACTDPDKLNFEPLGSTECISYEYTNNYEFVMRVMLPDQSTPTTFGRLLGVNFIDTAAFAEVTIDGGAASGGILPFGLLGSPGSGTESCIKDTAASALPPPCDGPATGQFGPYSVYKYAPGPSHCRSTNNVFIYSVGRGVDHPMSTWRNMYPTGTEVIEFCDANVPRPAPNSVFGDTGNKVPLIEQGLLSGGTYVGVSFPGRIARPGSPLRINPSGPADYRVDTTPLWSFLNGSAFASGCSSAVSAATTIEDKSNALKSCLSGWGPANGAIFTSSLNNSKRFAYVPQFAETVYSPAGVYHIQLIRPVYLQTLLFQEGATFHQIRPGDTGTWSGSLSFKALTSILLDCRMFSTPCDPDSSTGGTGPGVTEINRIRLSK